MLLKCPECGKMVSEYAAACLHCGYPGDRIKEAAKAYRVEQSKIKVGSEIQFGHYPQNEDGKDNPPIDWQVLDVQDGKILLISKYGLDSQSYHNSFYGVTRETWEPCSLRKWLNETFLNKAFSVDEQKEIQSSQVAAERNPRYNTNPGFSTTDKVFLLSISEVEKYFQPKEDRKVAPTAYAIEQGAYIDCRWKTAAGEASCWWGMRSPGDDSGSAALVNRDGSVHYAGASVLNGDGAVRPAMWIALCD